LIAAVLYANRFPNKRHLIHALFDFLFHRICQYDTLHAPTRPRNVFQRGEEMINQVKKAILANPHISTRYIVRELNIYHTKVHRIIKNNLR